jgi:adenine phosphoribosyltransferase
MALFAIDLPALGGMAALRADGIGCDALMTFEGD